MITFPASAVRVQNVLGFCEEVGEEQKKIGHALDDLYID